MKLHIKKRTPQPGLAKFSESKTHNMDGIASEPKEYLRSNGKKDYEKARRWVLTLHMAKGQQDPKKFSERDTMALRRFNLAAQTDPVVFCVFQPEIAPEAGTYHLQGYAEFNNKVSMAAVRKHFGEGVWCQVARGTPAQCIAYCSKDDTRVPEGEVVRFGKPMELNEKGGTSGSRTDWKDALEMLEDNKLPIDVVRKHPHIMPCVRALHHTRTEILRPLSRHKKTYVTVLWGSPDSGKSSTAHSMARERGPYFNLMTNGNGLWWDGYDPLVHKTIILDEFTGGKCSLTYLNMLLDMHPMQVEWKGGSFPLLAERCIITSNYHPKSWYDFENPDKRLCWPALLRRLETIVRFDIRETVTKSGSLREELWLEVEKGIFKAKTVQSRYPIHSIQDDSEDSIELDSRLTVSTPVRPTGTTRMPRIRRNQGGSLVASQSIEISESDESE